MAVEAGKRTLRPGFKKFMAPRRIFLAIIEVQECAEFIMMIFFIRRVKTSFEPFYYDSEPTANTIKFTLFL
ncbi:MAG: hypothetical protein JXC33_07455 [Deltaproteobacteria bacterium]|nr:hypothetical protein [Deltaproteobacteria bacterium]